MGSRIWALICLAFWSFFIMFLFFFKIIKGIVSNAIERKINLAIAFRRLIRGIS